MALGIYTTIIVSFIWARLKFFKFDSNTSKSASVLYDPIVAIQIVATYYGFSVDENNRPILSAICISLFILGIGIFWWAIRTAKSLNFAFSNDFEKLITTGPYAWIRHPLYFSYLVVWASATVLFQYSILWITLSYLLAFYIFSAKREEEVILRSEYSREYQEYSQNVGMFLPRITQWKN